MPAIVVVDGISCYPPDRQLSRILDRFPIGERAELVLSAAGGRLDRLLYGEDITESLTGSGKILQLRSLAPSG